VWCGVKVNVPWRGSEMLPLNLELMRWEWCEGCLVGELGPTVSELGILYGKIDHSALVTNSSSRENIS